MIRFAKVIAGLLILFLFLGDLTVAPARAAGDGPALVVLTFEMTLKENDVRGELLADLVTEGLGARFPVVERKNLAKVLAEQELTLSGLVATDQAVRAGKLSGAKFVVAGRVFRLGDRAFVSVRVISIETARFKGVSFSLPEEASVKELAERALADLARDLPRLQKELLAPVADVKPLEAPAEPAGKPMMVAVLNFANQGQGDPTWDWLGKGLADLTIGDLAGQELKVVSREQMQELIHELQLSKQNQDPQAVARVLKAAKCVHGAYHVTDGKIDMHASILDVLTGKPLHTAAASGAAEKVLDVQKQLAAELTAVLRGKRPGTFDAAKLPRWTENLKATQLLYQGIDRLQEQIQRFPADHPLYWIAWHEMLALKVDHLKATGELLTIPAAPPPYDAKVKENLFESPGGLHPTGVTTGGSLEHGNIQRGGDEPRMREFIVLNPKQDSRELDFSKDPLVPRKAIQPQRLAASPQGEIKVELAANEEVEIALNAKVPAQLPKGVTKGWISQPISTPYEVFRLSARMGDNVGIRPGDVSFCRDSRDRWIVLWNLRRDLFMAISADRGQSWSPTVQLPLPVNSAHDEKHPVMRQDAEGRYVLAFASDRNQSHTHAIYVCWSDDLVNFSAPVRISPGAGSPLHLFQRADGVYLLYARLLGTSKRPARMGGEAHFAVFTSRDLVHWSDSQEILAHDKGYPLILAMTEDGGRYLALTRRIPLPGPKVVHEVHMQTSEDGIVFSPPRVAVVVGAQFGGKGATDVVNATDILLRRDGNKVLAMAHSMQGRGVVLSHGDGANWPILANSAAPVEGRFWQGNFTFADNTLYYFSLPAPADAHTHVIYAGTQKGAERDWITSGQPLYLHRYAYGPQAVGASPETPGEATARIVKRRALPPRGNQ